MSRSYKNDLEKILGGVARVLAQEGDTAGVSVLALSTVTIDQVDYDNWNGGMYGYALTFEVSESLFRQIKHDTGRLAEIIATHFNALTPQYEDERINCVTITPELVEDKDWREKAKSWVTGQDITNQGRARSDNLAPRMCDGLLFRSQPEINLYRALKAVGVTFAPLPVFIRGGATYRRIEPDFVIVKNGVLLIVEVDGDTVHRETPLEAHNRTTMLAHEGAHVERVNASECDTPDKAKECAKKILAVIDKLRTNK